MALIAIAIFDTEENKRTEYTKQTLWYLAEYINWEGHPAKHRLVIIDNNSCKETKKFLDKFRSIPRTVITLDKNYGTAFAINKAWYMRDPGENCIKMDNDVIIYKEDWIDELEEAIKRDPKIGQVGLKRKDCWENPEHEDPHYKSKLKFLPHQPGETWITVEESNHIMGTCVMHSSALLDKVGYLYQPKLYGFDDALMSYRSQKAGFYNCFLPHIEIDHIDTGETPYQKWKENHASECWAEYHRLIRGYDDGSIPIYYNPYETVNSIN